MYKHALVLIYGFPTSIFFRHKNDGQILIDSSKATAINLTELHGSHFQELFEHDTILTLLSCSHAYT